jgi:hypothetical protein
MPEVSTLDTLKQTQKNSTTDKTENLKKNAGSGTMSDSGK